MWRLCAKPGFDDRAIVDANQIASYFNYVNRVVEGLGVELEAHWAGAERAERHYDLKSPRDSAR